MFKSHETRNNNCCPDPEKKSIPREDFNYWKNRPKNSKNRSEKYHKNTYESEDDDYCSCIWSDFDERAEKPIKHNRRSTRRETEKFDHIGRDRAKHPQIGTKYRSKSLGVEIDRSKFDKSANRHDKPRKTERRYSRRNLKKADGVTEVTSLEIVKNWSHEDPPPMTTRRKRENLDEKTRWPSRKSTKVIFARYSQDSMKGNLSERSTSANECNWSDEKSCVCDDALPNTFKPDCNIDDFSSECADFVDESMLKSRFLDENEASKQEDCCICYDCPLRGSRIDKRFCRPSMRNRYDELDKRTKVGLNSSMNQEGATKGRRLMATEKLSSDVVNVNKKYSSAKSKPTGRKCSVGRACVTRDADVQAELSEHERNFSRQKERGKKTKKRGYERRTKRIVSKVVEGNCPERHSVEAERHEKLCNMLNSRETGSVTNCCCMASQLDEDHGCSVDCRCPESFFTNWCKNPETPECRSPVSHRVVRTSSSKSPSKKFHPRQNCFGNVNGTSRSTEPIDYEEVIDHPKLSRIGYVEEYEECGSESNDRNVRKCDEQIFGDFLHDDSNCCCADEESNVRETPACDDCLDLEDLRPDVPPPDHWTKCGDHLSKITEEYRTLSSRLKEMQHEAELPETSGRVRKRVSRKYPSGKEFSFEIKTAHHCRDDDPRRGQSLDDGRDDYFCQCEQPLEDTPTECHEAPNFHGQIHHRLRSEKHNCDRSTQSVSVDDFLPCDCSPLERKKKRKRWKETSERTDFVKTLKSFCAKLQAINRESESTLNNKVKKISDQSESANCECDESEDDDEDSDMSCERYCDACVGTDSAGKGRDTSERITIAPKIVKPCGASRKPNLKKIFIYPPKGEEGPPLTLLKDSSDIGCTVVSDAKNRFRYRVTYTQKFLSPAWCPVDECCGGRDSDDYG